MRKTIISLTAALFLLISFWGCPKGSAVQPEKPDQQVETATVEVGPFDLHRRYRSMEGPWVAKNLRISDLLEKKHIVVPGSEILYVEGNPNASPSMTGSAPHTEGAVNASAQKRELYWFTGLKMDVLDENGKPLPNAEFICHLNIDVDPAFRKKAFPGAEQTTNSRIMTLTQGQTDFQFPQGYAVPVASDEVWSFTFQAANRTTNEHRSIKHRLTINFVKDSPASSQMKALYWYTPYITVIISGASPEAMAVENHGPSCLVSSAGMSAPNMAPGSEWRDARGRILSGHWVIPPGTSVWRSPILEERDPGFATKDKIIHAAWTHIHPLCTEAALIQCGDGTRQTIFSAKAETKTDGGLQIMHINNILSKKGIPLPGNKYYELEATYENPTKENQDSMVTYGIFMEDENFKRPDWHDAVIAQASTEAGSQAGSGETAGSRFCGVKPNNDSAATTTVAGTKSAYDYVPPYPLFDPALDGPLLSEEKTLELLTSAGKIYLILDPKLAPANATQIYRLLKAGAFDGTPIFRYEPNFVLQIESADRKIEGQPALPERERKTLRRLPLEISAQASGAVLHKKGVLSMAHYDQPDTGVSSFSIMLADAPHLNNKYTIFGRLADDAITAHTIEQIEKNWANGHPYIVGVQEVGPLKVVNQARIGQGQVVVDIQMENCPAHHAGL